jgi:phosphate:Na+ symporter
LSAPACSRFPQAIGVVFGASLGTTGTGWIIAVLGLKISVGFYALPLVGLGAFLKLLARGRWRSLGLALAGFGLIFIGIETLQDAMRGLSGVFNLARLPAGGLWGHLLAMIIGIAMTVIMQSSSAAVATTLTALHTGAINFDQAASLVIGAAVGTTVTGALAAIGGSVPAKRTALAHVLFNLATGLIAVVLLPVFLWGIGWAQEHAGLDARRDEPGGVPHGFHRRGRGDLSAVCGPVRPRHRTRAARSRAGLDPAFGQHRAAGAGGRAGSHAPRAARDSSGNVPSLADDARRNGRRARARHPAPPGVGPVAGVLSRKIPPVAEDEPLSQLRVAQLHAMDHLTRLQTRLTRPPACGGCWTRSACRPRCNWRGRFSNRAKRGCAAARRTTGCRKWNNGRPSWWNYGARNGRRSCNKPPAALRARPRAGVARCHALAGPLGYHTWRICHHLRGDNHAEPAQAAADAQLDD